MRKQTEDKKRSKKTRESQALTLMSKKGERRSRGRINIHIHTINTMTLGKQNGQL
jgi:hypothetical protein